MYLEDGDSSQALALMRSAAISEPNWFEVHITLAQSLMASGNPDEAFFEVNFSKDLIVNDEELAAVFYWRAIILEALQQEESALIDWSNLLALPEEAMPLEWRLSAEQRTVSE